MEEFVVSCVQVPTNCRCCDDECKCVSLSNICVDNKNSASGAACQVSMFSFRRRMKGFIIYCFTQSWLQQAQGTVQCYWVFGSWHRCT